MDKVRAEKIQEYLIEILECVKKDLNVNYIDSSKIGAFSIVRLPVNPMVEKWVIPVSVNQEVYNIESVKVYSQDQMQNLSNIGFFENLERKIKENNKNKKLPQIDGIESISCLNCGSLQMTNTNTAVFSIQIEINYREGL